jgi:hypothetical protein
MSEADKMIEMTLNIELRGFWHYGSGDVRGAQVDAVCKRDAFDLPMLGGRALKGLLRDAMRQAGLYELDKVTKQCFETLFGTDEQSGLIRVPSAYMRDQVAVKDASADQKATLFRLLSSTAIDPDKQVAKDKTLRCIEVAVPVPLISTIQLPTSYVDKLKACLPLIDALGAHRARGLGRCVISVGAKS